MENEEFCRERGRELTRRVSEDFIGDDNPIYCRRIGENLVVAQHYDEDWVFMPEFVKEWVDLNTGNPWFAKESIMSVTDTVVLMLVTRQLFRREGFSNIRVTRAMRWYDAAVADAVLASVYHKIVIGLGPPLREVVEKLAFAFLYCGPMRDQDLIPEMFGEITREE